MHNVDVEPLNETITTARAAPSAVVQRTSFAGAPAERLEEIKRIADDHCPGVYCVRNPIDLRTHLTVAGGSA